MEEQDGEHRCGLASLQDVVRGGAGWRTSLWVGQSSRCRAWRSRIENIVVDWPIFEMSCVEEQDGEHRCGLANLRDVVRGGAGWRTSLCIGQSSCSITVCSILSVAAYNGRVIGSPV